MKQLLTTLMLVFISINTFGQIRTSEVEVRSPTTSTVNEIEGETRIDGDLELKSDGGAELNLWNLSSGKRWQVVSGYTGGFEIGYVTENLIDELAPFFIGIDGQVGIGTTNPISKLTINDDNFDVLGKQGVLIGGGAIGLGNYTPAIGFANSIGTMDAAIAGVQETTDNNAMGLAFFVHPSAGSANPKEEAMRITKNGFVGIGTDTPSGKLEVSHTGNSELVVSGNGSGYSNAGLVLKANWDSSNQRALGVFMHDSTAANEWFAGRPYSNSDSYVIYRNPSTADHTSESSARNTESRQTGVEPLLTILGDGNVGIGNVSPSKKLEVYSETTDVAARFTSGNERVSLMLRDNNTSNGVGISGIGDDLQILTGSGSSIAATFNSAKNLGLGTETPRAKIHTVTGSATNFTWSPKSGTSAIFESSTLNRNFLTIVATGQSELWFADGDAQNRGKVRYIHSLDKMEFWTAAGRKMAIDSLGNVGIGLGSANPSEKLHVNGDVKANAFDNSSDRRWKKNISEISEVIRTLNNIHPVSYEWRVEEFPEKDFDSELHYGVIAQELEEVLPELVSTDNEGYKSVDYLGMIGLLVKGFQERGEEIARLQEEVGQLKKELTKKDLTFEARLVQIEKALNIKDNQGSEEKTSQ